MTDLPKGWACVALGDLGSWKGGGTPSKARPDYWGGPIPWVSPKDMKAAKITSTIDGITPEAVAVSATSLVSSGSILIVTRSGILAHTLPVAINGVDVAVNQDLKALTPWLGLSPDYIRLALKGHERDILNACVKDGTTVHSVELPALMAFKLPLPPLAEQHRIVAKIEALFSELDAGQDSLTRAQAQLRLYRQSLLKAAFQGRLTADWRAANSDKLEDPETLLARIKSERDARYKQALDDWQRTLAVSRAKGGVGRKPVRPKRPYDVQNENEIIQLHKSGWVTIPMGLVIDDPAYGTSKKCDYPPVGLGVLRIPNIASGVVDATDLKYAEFDEAECEAYRLESGDLLTIRSNGSVSLVGKTALIAEAQTSFLYAGYLIRLRPNQKVVDPRFLLRALESHDLRLQIESKAKSTSGVNNINSGELRELAIPICSLDEQREVVIRLDERLSSVDVIEAEITTTLTKIAALRQSTLKQAFSGRLVPQDPADEPASALLTRLREAAPVAKLRRGRKVSA